MCIDFRMLNDITIPDAFPLPRTDDLIEALGSAQIFSSMDLGSAFWQVGLPEEKKHTTAFATPEGLYEFNRMPFGLCNAAATFQRLMYKVMKKIQSKLSPVLHRRYTHGHEHSGGTPRPAGRSFPIPAGSGTEVEGCEMSTPPNGNNIPRKRWKNITD